MSAYLGGFAFACLVELKIPSALPSLLIIPFACISAITVGVFIYCSVASAMLVTAICQRKRTSSALGTDSMSDSEFLLFYGEISHLVRKYSPCADLAYDRDVCYSASLEELNAVETLFHQRWSQNVRRDWHFILFLLMIGTMCFMALSAIITFINTYTHDVWYISGALSSAIFLYGFFAGILPAFYKYSFVLRTD